MTDWKQPWQRARERVRESYGGHVGRSVGALPTPALVADLDAVERNLAVMTSYLRETGVGLRPHTKVQKSPDLALRQLEAGAIGMTAMSVWEAAGLAASGVPDVLIATEFAGRDKLTAAAALARQVRLTIVVDEAGAIEQLSQASVAAAASIDVLVDLDVGMGRSGVRSAGEALRLARLVDSAPGLTLTGIQAYEGHCVPVTDPVERQHLATAAMDYAHSVLRLLVDDGLPARVLTAGGTVTYDTTGRHPGVTELQAGSYLFMDTFHRERVPAFEISLTVLATVVDVSGGALLDSGGRLVDGEFVTPPIQGADPEATYLRSEVGSDPPRPGDRVRLLCGYAPNAINLYDVIFIVRGEQVVDAWPIFPRGPGHDGFYGSLGAGLGG